MFDSIVGNQPILEYLRRCVSNASISHATLFCGPPGVMKTKTAHELARYLMCEAGVGAPCGICAGCKLAAKGNHPDITVVSRRLDNGFGVESSKPLREDKAPKSISVETIRDVKADILVKPFRAKKKVYVVEEADLMTISAQNSFLKILEEPPDYAVIILITSRKAALLDTVLSRCVALDFQPLSPEEIQKCLLAEFPGRLEEGKAAALLCGGSLDKARSSMQNPQMLEQSASAGEMLRLLFLESQAKLIDVYLFLEKQKDSFPVIAAQMLSLLRDVISYKLGRPERAVFAAQRVLLQECASKKPLAKLLMIQETLLGAIQKYEQNANYNLLITQMILDCSGEDVYDRSRWSAV